MLSLIICLIIIFFVNFVIIKKNFFQSFTGSYHQTFTNSSVPFTGGIYIFFSLFLIILSYDYILFSVFTLIFVLGIFSDFNIFSSPKKRFFIQILLLSFFVFNQKLQVLPTRINIIDDNLPNTYWSYFFTIFCLMILINGANFIDGLNGLLFGYLIMILFILNKLNLLFIFGIDEKKIIYLGLIFIFIYFLNLSNQLFLGDSGAYSLSFLIGYLLIKLNNLEVNLSPYFIILLLWYPCFEILFSIIRKLIRKKSPFKPDNLHLHQLLFFFIWKFFKLKKIFANILSSHLINIFNFFILLYSTTNPNLTIFQIKVLVIALTGYLITYFFLNKFFLNFNDFEKKD